MVAMKPRTGDGPLEATKESHCNVMHIPADGGGCLVIELNDQEVIQLAKELEKFVKQTSSTSSQSKEPTISADKAPSWSYAEDFLLESENIAVACARGKELGATPVSPATGAALWMPAGATGAKSVIEVGTGAGASTLWTLAGMPTEDISTTTDSEVQIHQIARELLSRSGAPLTRARMITGRALQVLPRMSCGVYDMAIIDADSQETQAYVDLSLEALRPRGVLVVPHALWRDSVTGPVRREPDTVALREVLRTVRESNPWTKNLLICGDGLLMAIKNRQPLRLGYLSPSTS